MKALEEKRRQGIEKKGREIKESKNAGEELTHESSNSPLNFKGFLR